MKFKTTRSECVSNIDEFAGDGTCIQRRFIFNPKTRIITIKILRKVEYSWQNAGLDVNIDVDAHTATTDERGIVLVW